MMDNYRPILLNDRALIRVRGADVAHFLQNIITTDINSISAGDMLPGALLSAQGKILFDFLIGRCNDSFFIDIHSTLADSLVKRLNFYKLRASIEIRIEKYKIMYIFLGKLDFFTIYNLEEKSDRLVFNDKRLTKDFSAIRVYDFTDKEKLAFHRKQEWDSIRIVYGIAESGIDFELGEVYPHEINYDQINGISFKKGCYIGQEVVSRVQHRAAVRRRILVATATQILPFTIDAVIKGEGKPIGRLGTVIGMKAIALVRVDRIREMVNANSSITAHGIPLVLSIPKNVHFDLYN